MNNLFAVTSGKGGVGKSTVASSLAGAAELLGKKTLLIDLASAPGGVDIKAARELGANVIWATSLPGKYAPRSAGEMIGACVESYLQGEGEI